MSLAIAGSPLSPWSVDGAVAAYLESITSRRTAEEYARNLRAFLSLVPDPIRATPDQVYTFCYAPGPSGRRPSASTTNVRLASLTGWYAFLVDVGRLGTNPAAGIRRKRLAPPAVRGLDVGQVRALLRSIPDTDAGTRDRAIILTALLTGLRRSELLNLTRGDLSRNGKVYFTTRIKGGRVLRRELPMPAFEAISAALARAGRPLESLAPEDRVWDVSPRGFAANLARYGRRAKIEGLSVHALRHSAAKLRRDTGATVEDVQRLLNHTSLATTSRYLARLEGEDDPGWERVARLLAAPS